MNVCDVRSTNIVVTKICVNIRHNYVFFLFVQFSYCLTFDPFNSQPYSIKRMYSWYAYIHQSYVNRKIKLKSRLIHRKVFMSKVENCKIFNFLAVKFRPKNVKLIILSEWLRECKLSPSTDCRVLS